MYRGFHLIPHDTRIEFMRYHKITFAFSVIMVIGFDPADRLQGPEFRRRFRRRHPDRCHGAGTGRSGACVRSELSELGLGEISLQQFGKPENILIRLQHQNYHRAGSRSPRRRS